MRKYVLIGVVGIVAGILLSSVAIVLAGSMEPPSGPTDPASQMYTLEQIYNRLNTGAAVIKMTTFTEPSSGPGATGRTLDEVMAAAKPGALAPRVNKTGETDCHYGDGTAGTCTCGTANCPSGQDGDYEMGIDPAIAPAPGTSGGYNTPAWTGVRFTDNGDGTVTDNLTALTWLKNANCWGQQSWANALTNSNALADGQCGLTDGSSAGAWRLPNVNELHSLIDLTQSDPALPSGHPFDGVQSYYYWSSTTYTSGTTNAWGVYLNDGTMVNANKTVTFHVWPVRGGQ
jgi:hypothetical protein